MVIQTTCKYLYLTFTGKIVQN
uniref:Uncharacterized protein n=1 Tax=Anguilla anguilla TaxID=7936 RepID=A0A0E9RAN7_ANGAN